LKYQTGIYDDQFVPGLNSLVQAVHNEGGKIVFQLSHAGRQTSKDLIGLTPMGPSGVDRDPFYFQKPEPMDKDDIKDVIRSFGNAAGMAEEAGADAIQLHAAHGFLLNQFLSPFFNRRKDDWGGTDEKRFNFLRTVLWEVRKNLSKNFPILVKLNTTDYTPKEGISPPLARKYSQWLKQLGIDALEVSCGSAYYSFMNMVRGDVPVRELTGCLPLWMRPIGRMMIGRMKGKFELKEAYNLEAAKLIKTAIGEIPLMLVGGLRTLETMTRVIQDGHADLVSMSRPFIREPFLVKRFKEGKTDRASCISCNKCFAAVVNNMPTRCYQGGFPAK
jgi:2,4-dienoyl-CoA reductase-like NADH-dependent reductase (Old Yellow Enzyme family)